MSDDYASMGNIIRVSLNIQLFLLPGHVEVSMPVDEQIKKGFTLLMEIITSTFHERLWVALCVETRRSTLETCRLFWASLGNFMIYDNTTSQLMKSNLTR